MANEGSSKGFAKVFHKKVQRSKEKVLHSLGKADRTTDVRFGEYVHNFQRQQAVANKLQKELKNYINCVKAMQNASNSFYATISEIWEKEWLGYEHMNGSIEGLSRVWEAHLDRLNSEVQTPVGIYLAHFPEVRSKISKRGRKLVDYDSARHNLQSLENAKKRDETKIMKAQEELNDAQSVYDTINLELHNELPAFFDSRINNISSSLNSFLSVESKFQEESAKLKNAMATTADELQRYFHEGVSSTPQAAKCLRNGNMDNVDTVDMSRNEMSPGGYNGQESPMGSRHSNGKNSYRRSSSTSHSSTSDRGPETPGIQTRGSMQSFNKEELSQEKRRSSSRENSLVKEGQNRASLAEDPAYEYFNYDDGSYEAVNVRGQRNKFGLDLNFDDFPGEAQSLYYRLYGKNSNSIYIEGASVGESSDTTEKKVLSSPNSEVETPVVRQEKLKLDEEEEDSEDDEQVYNIPKSNEPVNNNIPQGVEVLYKNTNNQASSPLTDTAGKSGSSVTWESSGMKDSSILESFGIKDLEGSDHDYVTIIGGKPESVYQLEKLDENARKTNATLGHAFIGSNSGQGNHQTASQLSSFKPEETFPLSHDNIKSAMEKSNNPPAVPKRNFESSSQSASIPSASNCNASSGGELRSSQIETMLSRSRENIQTPSLIAAEKEVEAIFNQSDHWSQSTAVRADKDIHKSKPKNAAKPPRSHTKNSQSGKLGQNTRSHHAVGQIGSNPVNAEDAAALESFAKLESVFDQIDLFGTTPPAEDAFPNGGQTPTQKDPFAGEDPFTHETPSPVTGEFSLNDSQSKSQSSLFDPFDDPSPFGTSGNYKKTDDPFLPRDVSLDSFDPLAEIGFENSFTTNSMDSLGESSRDSNEKHVLFDNGVPVTTTPDLPEVTKVKALELADVEQTFSDSQQPNAAVHADIEIIVTGLDSSYGSQIMESFKTDNQIHESDLSESTSDPEPRFTERDEKEKSERESDTPVTSGIVLYRVIATHNYTGEDNDELNFESGEVICVVPFEDPEEQDDGWLYGIKESDGEKGVFPANFTRRL